MTQKRKQLLQQTLLIIALALCFNLSGLQAQKDYKWKGNPSLTEQIPEAFTDEDAVMVYEKEELLMTYDITRKIIKRRIKIQTELGLEKYARIVVPKQKYMHVSILDARTIKKDGSVVDLKASDIKSIDLVSEDDIFDKDEFYLFKVPGVEVGDEIETISVYEGQVYYTGGNVILHSYLPVIQAEYKLRIDRKLPFVSFRYNNMPEPLTENTLNEFHCTWRAKNLKGLFDQRSSIPYKSIPYSIYDFTPTNNRGYKLNQWDEIIKYIDSEVSDIRIRNRKKLKAIYEQILGDKIEASKIEQAKIIHDYINKEIQIMNIPESEQSNGIEYFLAEKKANFIILFTMYKNMLDRLDLKYKIAIGRERYLNGFHMESPALWQITHYLFLVEDEKKQLQIFPLKTNNIFYQVNEIPTELEGTNLLALNLEEKDSLKVFEVPFTNYKKNRRLRKIKTNVALNDKKIIHSFSEKMDGAVSTSIRHFYYNAQNEDKLEDVFRDLLSERVPGAELSHVKVSEMPDRAPFSYSVDYEISQKEKVTKLDEGVYNLSLQNWFAHDLQNVVVKGRLLDYYPRYSKIDAYNYYIEFDEPVKLANKENLDIKVDNEVGVYELTVNQINEKAISIRSKYIIKLNHVPVNSIHLLEALNEAASQSNSQGLIVEAAGGE